MQFMVGFITNKMLGTLCSCWTLEFSVTLVLLVSFIYVLQEIETATVCVEIVVFITSHNHGSLTADVGVVPSLACWIISESFYQVY